MSLPQPAIVASQLPRTGTTSYGRACNNCAKAKCKCILTTGPSGQSGPCERCLRLRKDCQPAPSIRKKPGRKPISKTAQLQDKLDDLVSLLRSAAAHSTNGTSANALLQQARSLSQAASGTESPPPGPGETVNNDYAPPGSQPTSTPSSGSSARDPQPGNPDRPTADYVPPSPISVDALSQANSENNYGVSAAEAEECLQTFRQKLPYLHFVHIPESTTAAQLRQEKPILWLTIMVACVKVVSRQQLLGEKFRALIAQKAVVEHQRSLDLLQGLVGFLGWSTYHLRLIGKPFMTMYSHLLAAIIQDLYYDRPPPKTTDGPHPMACMRLHGFIAKALPNSVRTTEESRAVLASWVVSACVGTFLRRTFAMPWTSHMEDCLRILDQNPDSPLDGILTQQVRMQRIAEEAPCHSLQPTWSEVSPHTRTICEFQINALLQRLETVRQNIPKTIPPEQVVICRLHEIATEIEIREIALYSSTSGGNSSPTCNPNASPTKALNPPSEPPNSSRITHLSTILTLLKEWYSILLQQHPSQFIAFAFPATSQIAYLTIVMYRLCTLEDPYWDRPMAHQTLDCFTILDRLADRFGAVPAACGVVADRAELDTWGACQRAIKHLKACWEPVFQRALGQNQNQESSAGTCAVMGSGNQNRGEGGIVSGTGNLYGSQVTGVGTQMMQQGGVQPNQLGTGAAAGDPMAGLSYDAAAWDNYPIDDMANQWIADMFSLSWDG
ncbi:hypothetical protein V8F20_011635 [Naviculisporaceae sp. PSN 640]